MSKSRRLRKSMTSKAEKRGPFVARENVYLSCLDVWWDVVMVAIRKEKR